MIGKDLMKIIKNYPILEKVRIVGGDYEFTCSDAKACGGGKIYDFPVTKYMITIDKICELFDEIKKVEPKIDHKMVHVLNVETDGIFKLESRPTQIVFTKEMVKFADLTSYFAEICRLKTRRYDQFQSAYDIFMAARYDMEKAINGPITIEAIYKEFKKYNVVYISEFNPVWSACIIKYLQKFIPINDVLDMSAGRGSRLIGALATGKKYTGTDPNDCMDYETIVNFYSYLSGGVAEIQNTGFEESQLEGRQFDLMLSSPPYFKLEIYSNAETDSVVKYPEINGWLNGFLKNSMRKILDHLRPGGIMAINIDNPIYDKMDYVNPMIGFEFPDANYIGVFSLTRITNNDHEVNISVWCWQKKKSD